jgi:histidine triad (HIT) family protein
MADEQCIFCMIAQNKIQSAKIVDNESCTAFLDIKPATKGHIQIIPKMHSPIFLELDEPVKQKIFSIALSIGQVLVKKLGATGVSYLINEGAGAGQRVAHCSINVIPRYENDGVSIGWPDKQMNQEEFEAYCSEIAAQFNSQDASKQTAKPETKIEKKAAEKEEKPDEAIKIKPRIPKYW